MQLQLLQPFREYQLEPWKWALLYKEDFAGVHFLWDLIGSSDSETMKIEEHARWRVQEETHSVPLSKKGTDPPTCLTKEKIGIGPAPTENAVSYFSTKYCNQSSVSSINSSHSLPPSRSFSFYFFLSPFLALVRTITNHQAVLAR
jgi:hypothetical protein